MHVCTVHVYMCICMYVQYMYVCKYVDSVLLFIYNLFICLSVGMSLFQLYVCIMYVCVCMCAYMFVSSYVCMHVHTCIPPYLPTYMHAFCTYMHTNLGLYM